MRETHHECPQCGQRVIDGTIQDGCRDPDCPEQEDKLEPAASETGFTLWRPPGYEITRDGCVFSITSNWRGYGRREMCQHDDNRGYLAVRLTVDNTRKKYRVHKLVVWAFIGIPSDAKLEVRHIDGNSKNNHIDNLVWGTCSENAQDRVKHGRQFMPPWHDPEFRAKAIAGMCRAQREVRHA